MRVAIAVAVALIIGLVAGMGIISYRADAQLAAVRADRDAAQSLAARLQEDLKIQERRCQTLESENAARDTRLKTLEAAPAHAAPPELEPNAAPDEFLEEAPQNQPGPRPGAPEDDQRRPGDNEENPWRDPERRAQMRENFRQGVNAFLSDRISQSPDPAEQQRLAALAEYSDYLIDLRSQMRDAETPEARDALEQEYETALSEVRQVVDEQQRSMIVNMAQSYGITTTEQQDAFVESVNNLMDDPLLRSTRMLTGPPGGHGHGHGRGPGMGRGMPF